MSYETIGREFNSGKVAHIFCIENDKLRNIDIKNNNFLLLLLYEGSVIIRFQNKDIVALSPCFICFSEKDNPVIIKKKNIRVNSIYFKHQ